MPPSRAPLLNIRQIEVFRFVMLTGSITDAARALGVSQPGITRMIRHVESRLGTALFLRRKGKLVPTAEARTLYREVQRVYHGVQAVQDVAAGLKRGVGAPLRILSSPNMGLELVPRALARLSREFAGVRLSVEVVTAAEMLTRLLTHSAEIAISSVGIDHPLLDTAPLGEWRLVCVMPSKHPLSALKLPGLVHMLRQRMVCFSVDTAQGAVIRSWFDERGIEPDASVEVRSGQLACALVRAGMGIAFVDDLTARSFRSEDLVAHPVKESPRFALSAITRADEPPSIAAKRLRDLVRDELRTLRDSAHVPR
jgi:DNA-binding transcriptional LysR family regulator